MMNPEDMAQMMAAEEAAEGEKPAAPRTETFNYDEIKLRFSTQCADFAQEVAACHTRRKARVKDTTRAEAITAKIISDDEHFIPRRIIDQNIARDVPAYAAYIEQSPVLMNFTDLRDPDNLPKALEAFFSRCARYDGWNISWISLADCVSLHGGGVLELTVDPKDTTEPTPAGLRVEYVPRDEFVIPADTRKSIQTLEMVGRKYQYYPWQLEEGAADGSFDPQVVSTILQGLREGDRNRMRDVYRLFIRRKGVVYVCWYTEAGQTWLKAPQPFSLGKIRQTPNGPVAAPITFFPFVWFQKAFQENDRLLQIKGRGSQDLADQDAITQLFTAVVNGTCLAASMSGSLGPDPMNPEQQESQPFKRNTIYPKPINFNQAQYPDPLILQVAQALSVTNAAAAGNVDYAVNNRVDSRKTAAEIKSAASQKTQLSSSQLLPFATGAREIYTRFWEVLQSRIVAGVIDCSDDVKEQAPHFYQLTPAGDIEVLKREETLTNLQAFYPIVANTPLGPKVLMRIMELMFPKEARQWGPLLDAPDTTGITAALLNILQNLPPETLATLDPETRANLQQIVQSASAAINPNGQPPAGVAATPNHPATPQAPQLNQG